MNHHRPRNKRKHRWEAPWCGSGEANPRAGRSLSRGPENARRHLEKVPVVRRQLASCGIQYRPYRKIARLLLYIFGRARQSNFLFSSPGTPTSSRT